MAAQGTGKGSSRCKEVQAVQGAMGVHAAAHLAHQACWGQEAPAGISVAHSQQDLIFNPPPPPRPGGLSFEF